MITKERIKQIREFHKKGNDSARKDSGKRRWHLLPMELMEGVVDVFQSSVDSGKYKPFSWTEMKSPEITCQDSIKRHQTAIEKGEMYDSDTGLLHYDHIITNLVILKYHFLQKEATSKEKNDNYTVSGVDQKWNHIKKFKGSTLRDVLIDEDIEATDVDSPDIEILDLKAYDVAVKNIYARNVNIRDIHAHTFVAKNIKASNIKAKLVLTTGGSCSCDSIRCDIFLGRFKSGEWLNREAEFEGEIWDNGEWVQSDVNPF